jgi:hypothetical protein
MVEGKEFLVAELSDMVWPEQLVVPAKRFRLFIAADAAIISNQMIETFSQSALEHGMVCCCCWGPDCERVHDCVDVPIVKDENGENKFRGPNPNDVIMTSWYTRDSLKEALWAFVHVNTPSDGLAVGSEYWLAVVVKNSDWAKTARNYLRRSKYVSD